MTGTENGPSLGPRSRLFQAAMGAEMQVLFSRVPLYFAENLPRNRPFTRLEAAFQYDMDRLLSNKRSKLEYSKMWSWDRGKVDRFIKEVDSNTDADLLSNPIKKALQKPNKKQATNAHIKQLKNSTLHEQNHNNTAINTQKTNVLFIEEREREKKPLCNSGIFTPEKQTKPTLLKSGAALIPLLKPCP